jgi:hypothetical protein
MHHVLHPCGLYNFLVNGQVNCEIPCTNLWFEGVLAPQQRHPPSHCHELWSKWNEIAIIYDVGSEGAARATTHRSACDRTNGASSDGKAVQVWNVDVRCQLGHESFSPIQQ